ncbi:MAG TPA: AMP-binding protein, partial [Burkholderiaceae bacterium]|nr:AMP-binding protein [Burkholderiaceae bacterium]
MFDPWVAGWLYADAVATTHAQPAAWPQRQQRRLHELIATVSARSTWWQARLAPAAAAGRGVDAMLHAVPVSRKRELMQHFDRWVTDPALQLPALGAFAHRHADAAVDFDGRFTVWESSGSSGEPALFVQDARSLAVADALELARGPHTLLGQGAGFLDGSLWAQRYAFVGAIDGPFASIVSLRRLQRVNPWARWAARAFSFLQPIDALAQRLNDWGPTVLMTYPTMARVLAEQQRQGRLRLRLNAVWTGGETLTATLRAAIGAAFACPLHDSYGASECLNIASECSAGALHLHADWVILEAVDGRGRCVPAGQFGATTLLTNLANTAQPIIRYDLGDRVRFVGPPCRCGSSLPVIEVEGREDEVLALRDASRRPVLLP